MITIDDMIRKLQAVRDKHGNLPLVRYPDTRFEPVTYFDPSPVRLIETPSPLGTGNVYFDFVAYGDEPTHLEI